MLHDVAREAPATLQADLCIVGAGAAGIAMARRLIGSGLRVALVESGGLQPDRITGSLNEGCNIGLPYYPLAETRERGFGGTTATWSGRCIPLDPVDFKTRSWVPHSGWPITYDELLPFYHQAQEVMQVGEFRYDESLWKDIGLEPQCFDPATFHVRFWRIKALRFGLAYRRLLEQAHMIDIYLNATAVQLVATDNGKGIDHLVLRTLSGRTAILRATHYVLATGGIENARLLLVSDALEPNGIGNDRDLVGRFFMEHPKNRCAVVKAKDPIPLLERWRKQFPRRLPRLWPTVLTNEAVQQRHGILNSSLAFYYRSLPGVNDASMQLWDDVAQFRLGAATLGHVKTLLPVLPSVPGNLVRRLLHRRSLIFSPQAIYLLVRGEQAPNPQSRVVLSRESDALGQRRADLDWRLSPLDKKSVRIITELFAAEFAARGLGEITPGAWLYDEDAGWPLPNGQDHHEHLQGGNHHIGTTRMASDPGRGVVDANGRVFGKSNLYITGSSVFPTSGWANPTLTIVALALRLADHLKSAPIGGRLHPQ